MDRSIEGICEEAAQAFLKASKPVALTGAGMSVDCGIPDFRSRDGLWSVFEPSEYATLTTFLEDPEKSWRMFRALAATVHGKNPGAAHYSLAKLECDSKLEGVITQNIDGLHTAAGSKNVIEIHGDCRSLQCLRCGEHEALDAQRLEEASVPLCGRCQYPLKPNVVLFEEAVRGLVRIETLLLSCDLLMVIGTSATVYPAAGFPHLVLSRGGQLLEFNLEPTEITPTCSLFFEGRVEETVPSFVKAALEL
jgi:NAD-dependent deacetylase